MDEHSGEFRSYVASTPCPDDRLTNLPEDLTSFVGRSEELGRVGELLGKTRLLTLVGAGGSGKTRLGLESARRASGRLADGACCVELAALEDADLLPGVAAAALGLRERPGRPVLEGVREHLSSRHTLLVLDNCEHLVDACAAMVDTLLRSGPGLLVLATSREALRVSG